MASDRPSDALIAAGTPAYRALTLAMLFAGFSTFSLLHAVQPMFATQCRLSAEAASLAVSLATRPLAIGIVVAGLASDCVVRWPLVADRFVVLRDAAMPLLYAEGAC